MQDWFDTWFNTPYYHTLYKNRNHNEAESFISTLMDELKLSKHTQILDLACGKGRHSIFLNEMGYQVVGVDLSEESIKYAQQFSNNSLDFFVHDMRYPMPGKSFGAVFNLFTSFGYFENQTDNLKVLKSISSYLTDEGVLIIDFLNADYVVSHLVKEEDKSVDDICFHINRSVEKGIIVKHIQFEADGKTHNYEERVQAIHLSEFKSLLEASNFSIEAVYGDYNLGKFDPQSSKRLIIQAKKQLN